MPLAPNLAPGLSWVDLLFQGQPSAVATAVVHAPGMMALIDPGPSSCLEALDLGLQQQGLVLSDVTHILLTHIHLDHAGATGTIVRRYPHAQVFVHERGAAHMADPEKLISSAARLYGDQMDRLWGEFAPVPERNLTALVGGERIEAGGRSFEVAYTPGHASHHVSYFDRSSGVAFVGDTAGMCIDGGYVLPPTPPPDIDVEAWGRSARLIEAWSPETLFLTHFGPARGAAAHLQTFVQNLEVMAGLVRAGLEEPGTDEEKSRRFSEAVQSELRQKMTEEQVAAYVLTAPPHLLWLGLARYWKKRLGQA
jgi:glyoxylase-like metal-dependent hydrolase (beta-lactamase superfamily II)